MVYCAVEKQSHHRTVEDMVYCAVEKQSHHRTVEDLLKKAEPVPPPDDAPVKEKMAFRLKTQAGRTVYKKRKETVEPVFGIIKTILGFRGFLLRGLDKVSIEWDIQFQTTSQTLRRESA